jgi:hypothetical protein
MANGEKLAKSFTHWLKPPQLRRKVGAVPPRLTTLAPPRRML